MATSDESFKEDQLSRVLSHVLHSVICKFCNQHIVKKSLKKKLEYWEIIVSKHLLPGFHPL